MTSQKKLVQEGEVMELLVVLISPCYVTRFAFKCNEVPGVAVAPSCA